MNWMHVGAGVLLTCGVMLVVLPIIGATINAPDYDERFNIASVLIGMACVGIAAGLL